MNIINCYVELNNCIKSLTKHEIYVSVKLKNSNRTRIIHKKENNLFDAYDFYYGKENLDVTKSTFCFGYNKEELINKMQKYDKINNLTIESFNKIK